MDIVYHYPPELFNLLIQAIPSLFRSKNDVLIFFKGSGVDAEILDDLWQQVKKDRNSISKYNITQIVLNRLNQKGEATLGERREILKRVTEFEDFSTCWPNEQHKAKGLVSDIRRVINIKDSFTRIKLEKEQESKKHKDEYQKQIEAAKERQDELAGIKDELFALFGIPEGERQKRGKLLEGILNRLFKIDNILVREAFEVVGQEGEGIIEQIDGVIEIDGYLYLVEMKWWSKPLGQSEVSSHILKIHNREEVGGIFISASGYTEPAITICRETLSKRVVVLCELEEIVLLLEKRENLKAFLKAKIDSAKLDKKPLFKPLSSN